MENLANRSPRHFSVSFRLVLYSMPAFFCDASGEGKKERGGKKKEKEKGEKIVTREKDFAVAGNLSFPLP